MRARKLFLIFSSLTFAISGICQGPAQISVRYTPKKVFIEKTKNGQELSFDFILDNKTATSLELTKVNLTVFDETGAVILEKSAWSGLDMTLPSSFIIEPGKTKLLFNPFYSFNSAVRLGKLRYEFFFSETVEQNAKSYSTEVTASPISFQPKTRLILPVQGRILVYEGHDFLAHHRRVDLTNPVVAQLGVTINPTRYGYDFIPVNERGEQFRKDGKTNEDWFGFGSLILAPAGGIVRESRNTVDDNILGQKMFDFRLVFEDIKAFYGNYVIIDHQNGEYSVLLHLKKGSVLVKPGDRVKQGQPIAQMGISGDADYVHLHYQLISGLEINSESLPSYFDNFRWWHGQTFTLIKTGSLESGDIVERVQTK